MRDHTAASRMGMHDIAPSGRAIVVAVVAWSLAWKGASLWRAARNGSKPWFVTLLLTNTLGALDAVYLFGVDRRRRRDELEELAILELTGEPEQRGHDQET
ncbi:DUF5652 family protein [uncultured Leifsonia sp.]|uniref:DUF5652 family protein n=1 Tax=uncultured Leifsonia sp. TaxID=340359 RepID=UPI0028D5FB9F|nr:DUF5652 family protein [uncultured Leifsonia sp.]